MLTSCTTGYFVLDNVLSYGVLRVRQRPEGYGVLRVRQRPELRGISI